ncbi:MAG: Gfo/Idh/MocA family oxidoreductase [Calditrichaeota bacterium]|nr:Gfo/Idh/MocA family oxidoreductase [Calditrichota bacterium]MCB9391555.1 Gfo/Idh/MocA family oxidoreductase [Calditrichota bacterium]
MSEKLRIGIIGAGGVSQLFHIPLLKKSASADLVAIADSDYAKAAAISEKAKIPTCYRDAEKLLADPDIDAVHINTPTNAHLALTLAALAAGKHVLVEKPMARKSEEAYRMAEAAKKAGRVLMVGMNLRFRPDVMVLHEFIQGGELGHVRVVRANWLKRKETWSRSPWLHESRISGGGVLMDLGLQLLDMCWWVLGRPKVKRVTATTSKDRLNLRVEDTFSAYFCFHGGAALQLNSTWAYLSDESAAMTVFSGNKGLAELNPLKITKEIHGSLVNVTPAGPQLRAQSLYNKSFEYEFEHFHNVINGKAKLVSPAEDAAHMLEVIEATYRSAAENREVQIGAES